jgi:hypothetical protein
MTAVGQIRTIGLIAVAAGSAPKADIPPQHDPRRLDITHTHA